MPRFGQTLFPLAPATAYVVASDAPAAVIASAQMAKSTYGNLIQICDGSADNVEIEAAIDTLTNGGVVRLSAGTFVLAASCTVNSNITIEGEGLATVLQGAGGVYCLHADGSSGSHKSNIVMQNLRLSSGARGIVAEYVDGITIQNCSITSMTGLGIYVLSTCTNVNIVNNVVSSSAENIKVESTVGNESSRVVISNNVVTNGAQGINVIYAQEVTISGNVIQGVSAGITHTGILVLSCSDISVTGNTTRNTTETGIEINASTQCTVTGNAVTTTATGIWVGDGATKVTLVGNKVTDTSGIGILVSDNGTTACTDFSIAGNVVEGTASESAIEINGCHRGTILGNELAPTSARGIRLLGRAPLSVVPTYISIVGNLLHLPSAGISIEGGGSRWLNISDNVINQSTGNGIYISGSYINITNNTLDRCGSGGSSGLNVESGDDVSVKGNTILTSKVYNILVDAAVDHINIVNNNLRNSGETGNISNASSNTFIRNNRGYTTEASGTATINNGTTSVVITHNLSTTPGVQHFSITFSESPSNDVGTPWVDTITSTQATIHVRNDPGVSNLDLGWKVIIV